MLIRTGTYSGPALQSRTKPACGGGLINEAVLSQIDKISSRPVPEFIEATVRMGAIIVAAENNESITEIWVAVASAYLAYNAAVPPPPQEVQNLVESSTRHNLPLILGYDANAHYTVWGSLDINSRGEALLIYLDTINLSTLNRGTTPIFSNFCRSETIDLTLCSIDIVDAIRGWKVSNEPSLSLSRIICRYYFIGKAPQ